ncbi:hypothetical protein [Adhaeribacter pallidiroseus]|uniref:Uncharacterized protein n=1 Tax=Adhaeribacter pallidiroseus TaxID=2072847 RepID=A0A369QQI7_9BACT|nr:hypothetical protein [Adhaeribacter pallidiroseus]RDC65109.1 hypothetical protein AHMF7616_03733 [Adhaeribacter pallidiroseus]
MKKVTYSLLLTWLFINYGFSANAQNGIETRLGYSYNDKYAFTDEWQYLSTDIYLFNGNKFTRVINELRTGAGRDKKNYKQELEYLLITAQLKNLKLFGNESIVYPLYNFYVKNDNKELTAQVSDNIDVIRIIDKMPLSSTGKSIDATIEAKAIADNASEQVFNMVALQLQNIANLTASPSGALMSLVGEFGKLLGSSSRKTEYKFSSTIRLYEGHNFDTRLHSVRVYALVPPDVKNVVIKSAKANELLANSSNGLDRRKLETVFDYKDYPYLVVANYKSLYKTDVLSGNEINTELIEKRKQKINNAHDAGLVNDETFKQEMYFIEFLRTFADLKQSLNDYKLNYKNNISEVNSKSLFSVIQNYRALKTVQRVREREFTKNTTYQNIFRPEYASIVNSAELYLDADHNLKNSKDLVLTLLELENDGKNVANVPKREAYLTKLHSVDLPGRDFLSATIEGESITRIIAELENQQYREVFEKETNRLTEAEASEETLNLRTNLTEKASATKCYLCRDYVKTAITNYDTRYESYRLKQALEHNNVLQATANKKSLEYLKKKYCIETNIKSKYTAEGNLPPHIVQLTERNNELIKQVEQLNQLLKQKPDEKKLDALLDYNTQLNQFLIKLDEGYSTICTAEKGLCPCEGS